MKIHVRYDKHSCYAWPANGDGEASSWLEHTLCRLVGEFVRPRVRVALETWSDQWPRVYSGELEASEVIETVQAYHLTWHLGTTVVHEAIKAGVSVDLDNRGGEQDA